MPGKPKKPQKRTMELLAYQPTGECFSWYQCDARKLLTVRKKRGPTWEKTIRDRLAQVSGPISYLDMATIGDPKVRVELLAFTPRTAMVELHRNGELVALASLHRSPVPKEAGRLAMLAKTTLPMWRSDSIIEDLLTIERGSVMFLIQAPGDAAHAHWTTIYEAALLMMATFVCDDDTGGGVEGKA